MLEAPPSFWQFHFWDKVEKTPEHWHWRGRIISRSVPYGVISSKVVSARPRLAHHIAWELIHGQPLARNERLLNQCGNTLCVRPDHWKCVSSGFVQGSKAELYIRNQSIFREHMDNPERTYQEIGKKHGLSRQRVQQIIKKFLP